MSGLDMLSNNKRARSYASYTPTGFGEIAGTRFIATAYESPDSIVNIPASFDAIREIEKRNTLIKQRFNVDDPYAVIDVSDIDERYSNPTTDGRIKANKEKLERLDVYIQEQRKSRPDLWGDIKTKAEIDQPMIGRAREARKVADETITRAESGFAAVGGSLAGGFGGAMTGAVNLATLPFGFGTSRGILQTMAMEGALNASLEAAQIPMRKEWMDTLGHKYGLKEAAMDVVFAGAGAAALTGVIRGAGRGIRAFNERGSKGMEVMSHMSDDISVPKEGRDALKYQSRIAHIDEEIPVSGATREDVAVHRANVVETERAIQENRAPVYEEFEGVDVVTPKEIKSLPRSAYLNEPDVPTKKVLEKNGRVETVPLDSVRSHQSNMRWGDFEKGQHPAPLIDGFGDKPVAGRLENGEYIIFDGNHRTVKAINSGKKSMPMHVIDVKTYDPANAGRSSVATKKGEDDDLLAELAAPVRGTDAPLQDERVGFEAMRATVEAAEETAPTFEADFARLLKDNPDMKLDMDGETISLKEISARIKEDADIINAMKVCAIG